MEMNKSAESNLYKFQTLVLDSLTLQGLVYISPLFANSSYNLEVLIENI